MTSTANMVYLSYKVVHSLRHLIDSIFSGIHGWAIFSLVGLLLSIMSYREKLPLTMKSCFYPLIGDGIFGWMGDFVDVFSIMATLFGVCTSLGIGARQVAMGLSLIDSSIDSDDIKLQVRISKSNIFLFEPLLNS